jgi:uncharacterized protein
MTLLKDDKLLLLRLARESITSELTGIEINKDLIYEVKKFDLKKGIFVTLTKKGELRGCIGHVIPILPEYNAIIECAKSAAFRDPRFSPLERSELPFISIEISVLTPMEKLEVIKPEEYFDKIKIGTHGLFIEVKTGEAGLLLPQVFVEHKVDSLHALQMTCQKAGLPLNAWKNKEINIFTFEAEIFNEK